MRPTSAGFRLSPAGIQQAFDCRLHKILDEFTAPHYSKTVYVFENTDTATARRIALLDVRSNLEPYPLQAISWD